MIVNKSVLNGLLPVAEGYKIFNYDWTANYGDNYCYADKDGNVEGVVHRQEGFPNKCHNGLHFCENPLDCFNYYPIVQWNKFAKVKGYGAISRDDKDSKVAVEILEIVKVLNFEEFVGEIKSYTTNITGYGISYGFGINNGYGISYGYGINTGYGIRIGFGINAGYGINNGYGIRYGYGINNGYGINTGYGISYGYGIFNCYYIKKCEGLAYSIMCINETGRYKLFNLNIDKERFDEVKENIRKCADGWYPKFTNAFDYYKKEKKWECVPAPRIEGVDDKTAYKDMPKKLIEYFKSLPEFNAEIFTAITGRAV